MLEGHLWERSAMQSFDPFMAQTSRRRKGVFNWVNIDGEAAGDQ